MVEDKRLAAQALHEIADVFQVEKDRSQWSEDGFDWWPGDFRVSVRAQTDWKQRDPGTWRLLVKTDCLKDVPVSERHFKLLAPTVSRFLAPTFAWAYAPEEAWRRRELEEKPKLWFVSCAYLDERNAGWVPTFLAQMSIMQPINAQIQAAFLVDMLKGGAPDVSRPEHLAHAGPHGILSLAEHVFVPLGQEKCRWIGTGEFFDFAEKYARNDNCFGTGDETGITLIGNVHCAVDGFSSAVAAPNAVAGPGRQDHYGDHQKSGRVSVVVS
jgi:hypothetical protein